MDQIENIRRNPCQIRARVETVFFKSSNTRLAPLLKPRGHFTYKKGSSIVRRLFAVKFSEHLGPDERRTLASNLDAKGVIIETVPGTDVRLVVFRESKIALTRIQLANYERLGWLKWSEEEFTEPAP